MYHVERAVGQIGLTNSRIWFKSFGLQNTEKAQHLPFRPIQMQQIPQI